MVSVYLYKLEFLGRRLIHFISDPDICAYKAVYDEANIKLNRLQSLCVRNKVFLSWITLIKWFLVNNLFIRGLVVIGERQVFSPR